MLELGTPAPEFSLPDTDGKLVSLSDFSRDPALVVMFLCNHCPYVKHIREGLAAFGRDYAGQGVGVVAISSNDVSYRVEDSPEKMREEKRAAGYLFPYLYDETQMIAKAYRAACTPDFYLFDKQRKLVYRGQFDDSRPNNDRPVSGRDLRAAVEQLRQGRLPAPQQTPSVGCNIKWKTGNAPEYYRG